MHSSHRARIRDANVIVAIALLVFIFASLGIAI